MAYEHYTLSRLREEFPDEESCLLAIFKARYGDNPQCPRCKVHGRFYRMRTRKSWSCVCGWHVHPTAGTIFHKSYTPLVDWFYIIYLFSVSKHGVAAKEVERQLGVTYKTAHRMCKQIRSAMHIEYEDEAKDLLRKQFLTSIEGTHHHISSKYFQFYLAEFLFRWEHRKDGITPLLFERVLKHTEVASDG